MKKLTFAISCLLSAQAWADVRVEVPVLSATVYPQYAQIMRQAQIKDVRKGEVIEIRIPHHLSKNIAQTMIHIDGGELLATGTYTENAKAKNAEYDTQFIKLDEQIRELAGLREGIAQNLRLKDLAKAQKESQKLTEELIGYSQELQTLRDTMRRLQKEGGEKGIALSVKPLQKTLTITLQEQTDKASWTPQMRLELDSKKKKVRWQSVALIKQHTPLDWQNVQLTLSLSPAYYAMIPPYYPQTVGVRENHPSDVMPLAAKGPMLISEAALPAHAPAGLYETNGQYRFNLAGKYSLKQDAELASPYLEGEANARIYTAIYQYDAQPQAIIEATWQLPQDMPFVSTGEMHIFRDGLWVGEAFLDKAWQKGQEETLSFGQDTDVLVKKIDKTNVSDEQKRLFKEDEAIEQVQAHYRVENLSKEEKNIRFYASLPIARDTATKVTPQFSPKADEANVNQQEGLYRWQFSLKAGKTWTLDYGYDIRYPKDKTLH